MKEIYNDDGYSDGYSEGDNRSSEVTNCDLGQVNAELALIKQQNIDLNTKLDTLLSAINSNKILSLAITDKVNIIKSNIADIPEIDISNLVTTDYIDSKVPFVDDKSITLYPKGSLVICTIAGGSFIVESSRFLPINEHDYTVVYTLSKNVKDDTLPKVYSDFNSKYVLLFDEDLYMLMSDCSDYQSSS